MKNGDGESPVPLGTEKDSPIKRAVFYFLIFISHNLIKIYNLGGAYEKKEIDFMAPGSCTGYTDEFFRGGGISLAR